MSTGLSIEGACPVGGWGVISARGAEAGKFLQGQLTNDILGLGNDRACLAGFCSAKGRLQASFIVWQPAPDDFRLACSSSILVATLKRLSMFVLRAKCRLADASQELALWGVAGAAAETGLGNAALWERRDIEASTWIRVADASGVRRALVAVPAGAAFAPPAAGNLTAGAWRWMEVQSGVVTIEAGTVDRFVPQMVNYELLGGVDFHKGCYPGQEVVARSQYRGTTRRRTFLFDCDVLPTVGQDVFSSRLPGEAAGVVANAAARPDGAGATALVEVRLAALGDDELHVGAVDGPLLRRTAMPYAIPLEGEAAV